MSALPITRVVLYKHGVGYFEREGSVDGDATLALTFKQAEVSDVLKSLTVLDLGGGHIASVSYDSTKPLEQLLSEVALTIPDQGSLVSLLPQLKGARVALHQGVGDPIEGSILGIDTTERQTGDGIVHIVLISLVTDAGEVRSFDLHNLAGLQILDPALRRDLDFYLKTQLSAKKKDARTFTFFAQGQGQRGIRISYTLAAPVWKATYRILLGEEGKPPLIQGWAVVDNTLDEDWENVQLALIAGLPVSFVHDLYTPRYIRRPEVRVKETTGVLPPEVEESMAVMSDELNLLDDDAMEMPASNAPIRYLASGRAGAMAKRGAPSSMPAQVRERKIGDLFEYEIEHPVTIRRNQSALVPIVLRGFEGRSVLLYNQATRVENPMRCVEFKNTTGLTLEGGPVTVLEAGNYVGEAMLETTKPDDQRLVPYAVELSVHVLVDSSKRPERVHHIVIRAGQLKAQHGEVQTTTYTLNNKSDVEQATYLEHPRSSDWELEGTPAPVEITQNHWRFRFPLPAKQITTFVVRQKRALLTTYHMTDTPESVLTMWIERKYFDAKTTKLIKQVMDLRGDLGKIDAAVADVEKERERIHAEQKRIRENLQALGDRASEKELRERIVKTLGAQEDRLEKIDRELRDHVKARAAARAKIDEVLAKLDYDADVGNV